MSASPSPRPAAETPLSRYRTLPGAADELLDDAGGVRPAWARLAGMLEGLDAEALDQRLARAHQYMRDAGVYYRVHAGLGSAEREWPLAPLPVLLPESDWRAIGQGLVQRAELLERVCADLYGDHALVRDGLIPPELIAANPEFLRPLVGITPRDGHYLHFCAFELGRGPDGRWWVLGDRTQAPSGAGFALENRVATMRAFPDLPEGMHVHRLAGFFRRFRSALVALAGGQDDAIAILTPGQHNETYYEHAWIARYLGVLLLEGEDLTVRNGVPMVRTVAGLQPISVLWRRMDAAFMDPLELRPDSWIGTPGIVGALRDGNALALNALGSGLLESRALQAFLPGICRALTGAELALPGIATWWCGQPAERDEAIAQLDRMMLGPALSTRLPYDDPDATLHSDALDPDDRARLLSLLRSDGASWVAQETVTLSTTPTWVDGRLEARPFVLRCFLARTANGWEVMPGGFARIGAQADARAIAMQRGGQAADVWIVADAAVEQDSLFPAAGAHMHRRSHAGALPSRAAENLLWLGRYTERAEAVARILRAYHVRLAESQRHPPPVLETLREYLDWSEVDVAQPVPEGLLQCLDAAATSAGRIRDRFSPDGWSALNDLTRTAHRFAERVEAGDDASRAVTVLLRKLAGFSGLLHENMYRSLGWRFLEIGRRLERGLQTASLLALLGREDAPAGLEQAVLEIGDSVMTHRARYGVQARVHSVLDLLALDPANPRAVMFQLEVLREQFAQLPVRTQDGMPGFAREALRLHTALSTRDAGSLLPQDLAQVSNRIAGLYGQLAQDYFD